MATLQASLRTIAGEGAPLVDLVARLNRYACAHSQGGQRFTTAVLSDTIRRRGVLATSTPVTMRRFFDARTAHLKT